MKRYQVVGIGNAIVDVFTQADDSFLELMGIEKGIINWSNANGASCFMPQWPTAFRLRAGRLPIHWRVWAIWV